MIQDQGNIIQTQASCIRELESGDQHSGRLLWRLRVPENRNATIQSPSFHTSDRGHKVSLVLDPTDRVSADDDEMCSLVLKQERSTNSRRDFNGTCHVTIFDQSQHREDYKCSFPCKLQKDFQSTDTEEKMGLSTLMTNEALFTWPFTKDNGILILVDIKPTVLC